MVNAPTLFAGIDVSKAHLDLYAQGMKKPRRYDNSERGIAQLLAAIDAQATACVAIESTGGYERPVTHALLDARVPVAIVNPLNVRYFAKALGHFAKTDAIDARVLADYAEKARPRVLDAQRDKIGLMLKELTARRRQLIDVCTMQKNQLQQATLPMLKQSIDALIKTLCQQIKQVDQAIQSLIDSQPELKQRQERLLSVAGVGPAVSRVLISELPELGTINRKKIAGLVGVAPMNDDSGTIKGKRMIRGGRPTVRAALYMATLVGTRHNAVVKAKYEHLVARGKPKKVAIVACMRSLLGYLSVVVNTPIEQLRPAAGGGEKE
jgi:transposase